jgi:hypothetical protein
MSYPTVLCLIINNLQNHGLKPWVKRTHEFILALKKPWVNVGKTMRNVINTSTLCDLTHEFETVGLWVKNHGFVYPTVWHGFPPLKGGTQTMGLKTVET